MLGEKLLANLFLCYCLHLSSLAHYLTHLISSCRMYIQTKIKSWKSWLHWAISAIFSSLQAILKRISAIKNWNCWMPKKLMSHICTFFVKFWVFKTEFLGNHQVQTAYWAQNITEIYRWSRYALSVFRDVILLALSDNGEHTSMLMRQKM